MNRCYQCDAYTSDDAGARNPQMAGFGLCGGCAIERRRAMGADASYPRNRHGGLLAASSKGATAHRSGFRWRIASAAICKAADHYQRAYGFRPESLTATSLSEVL